VFANKRAGFTLTELLVASAIIALLAAMLFPVLLSARSSANQSVCLSHFHQVELAQLLYTDDYDSRFTPVDYTPGVPSTSRTDRTWVQLLLPYSPSFSTFLCPADQDGFHPEVTFDQDLVPGDLFSRYYQASQRVDEGFNYMALSPIVRTGRIWTADPRSSDQVQDPSGTMMYVDSTWSVDRNGNPLGGGNWLVEPPCRYLSTSAGLIDEFSADGRSFGNIYTVGNGWTGFGTGTRPYGGAWPRHFERMNIVRVDGSATSISAGSLATGCTVLRDWAGSLDPSENNIWTITNDSGSR